MASVCRSLLTAVGSRSMAGRTRTLALKTLNPMPVSSSSRKLPSVSRIVSSLATVESLIPLHSAIASARLKSKIAIDSHCWSWLSEVHKGSGRRVNQRSEEIKGVNQTSQVL